MDLLYIIGCVAILVPFILLTWQHRENMERPCLQHLLLPWPGHVTSRLGCDASRNKHEGREGVRVVHPVLPVECLVIMPGCGECLGYYYMRVLIPLKKPVCVHSYTFL